MLENMQRIVSIADANTSSSVMGTHNADTLDDYEVIAKLQKKKTVTVPRVQSMQDYILKHHKRMILAEINRQLDGGTLQEIAQDTQPLLPCALEIADSGI